MPKKPPLLPYQIRFGQNVATSRRKVALSQEKVAELIGVSGRYYQSIEAGRYYPSLGKLLLLQDALNCPWADFFDGCETVKIDG